MSEYLVAFAVAAVACALYVVWERPGRGAVVRAVSVATLGAVAVVALFSLLGDVPGASVLGGGFVAAFVAVARLAPTPDPA